MGGIVTKKIINHMIPFIAIVGVILGVTFVYAYFEDTISVTNHIAVGDVNIGIKEYEIKNGREVLYENNRMVFPGDVISKIPRIKNYANECWVRVKMVYADNLERVDGINEKHIIGMSEDWLLRGEYYYYKNILKENETVDVFQQVIIPEEWDEEHSQQMFSIDIQVEAIQAANFKPDFTAMSPWGNQDIELCIHEENGTVACLKQRMELYVEFNGKAHKLLAAPGDFFHNIKRVMPGDVYGDEISLLNTTDDDVELFFKTEVENLNEEQLELLEKISLIISLDDKKLYTGNLMSKELETNVSLGMYKPGEEGILRFEIQIPKELKNIYALREANVKWIFSVFEEEDNSKKTDDSSEYPVEKNVVETGDTSPILYMIGLVLFAITGIVGIVIKKKRRTDTDEK